MIRSVNGVQPRSEKRGGVWKKIVRQRYLIAMIMPAVVILLIFHYFPIYGIVIAFKNYKPAFGIMNSEWVGFKYFEQFFANKFSVRIIRNSLLLGVYSFLWGFPAPILLALLLNEIRSTRYKRLVQTVTYLPHFISTVIVVGLLKNLMALDGLVNSITAVFGGTPTVFFSEPEYFRTLYIASGIWQGVGWGSIIYLAALSGVDPVLYEAATIDGANRFKQALHITIPSIMPTVVILMILNVQGILGSDTQKILLMYNTATYETADTINTYVYREGFENAKYSYSAAVGLMMSLISLVMVLGMNKLAKTVSEYSLW